MPRKGQNDDAWAKAKRLCRLSADDVRMARELNMNPRKLIKNRPNKSEPWKDPVHDWILRLHDRHMRKLARRQARKRQATAADAAETPTGEERPASTEPEELDDGPLDPIPF